MLAAIEVQYWCWWPDSNGRPTDYESVALPTELHQRSHVLRAAHYTAPLPRRPRSVKYFTQCCAASRRLVRDYRRRSRALAACVDGSVACMLDKGRHHAQRNGLHSHRGDDHGRHRRDSRRRCDPFVHRLHHAQQDPGGNHHLARNADQDGTVLPGSAHLLGRMPAQHGRSAACRAQVFHHRLQQPDHDHLLDYRDRHRRQRYGLLLLHDRSGKQPGDRKCARRLDTARHELLGLKKRRHMLNRRRSQRGFTLIEIMISLTVLGILLMVALPSFGTWLQNQQLRAASEATLNGLQVARAAAIRRNVLVQFVSGPGTGWSATEVGTGLGVESRAHEEGSPNAVLIVTPAGATTVTFTPLGSVVANADLSLTVTQFDVRNPAGGSCQPGGPMRCLRVAISGGGSLRMCDPTSTLPANDPRAC